MLQATKLIGATLVLIIAVLLILIVVGVLSFDDLSGSVAKIGGVAAIVLVATGIIAALNSGGKK